MFESTRYSILCLDVSILFSIYSFVSRSRHGKVNSGRSGSYLIMLDFHLRRLLFEQEKRGVVSLNGDKTGISKIKSVSHVSLNNTFAMFFHFELFLDLAALY